LAAINPAVTAVIILGFKSGNTFTISYNDVEFKISEEAEPEIIFADSYVFQINISDNEDL